MYIFSLVQLTNIIVNAAYTIYETESGIYVSIPPVRFVLSVTVKLNGIFGVAIFTPEIA